MLRKYLLLSILLITCMLLGATACSNDEEHLLSGSYTAQGNINQMNYSFDEDNNVTVSFTSGNVSLYSVTGTYEIDSTGSAITFNFPNGEEGAKDYLPGEMLTLSGAFTFKQEDDCIWIGTVKFQKDNALDGLKNTALQNQ